MIDTTALFVIYYLTQIHKINEKIIHVQYVPATWLALMAPIIRRAAELDPLSSTETPDVDGSTPELPWIVLSLDKSSEISSAFTIFLLFNPAFKSAGKVRTRVYAL